MRRVVALALVLAMLGWVVPARAEIGTIDHVPAATLLLPYFEVDLNNPNGLTTLFSINNASATAVLAHVIIWSDLSVHVLDFDVYLTGYDVQTINLRDIIVSGLLPQTASAGQDPGDKISPKGPFSQDINFISCNGILPEAPLQPIYVAHLQTSLTGKASPLPISGIQGKCVAQALGDNIARGYITVDAVNQCSFNFPGDGQAPTYFLPGGRGIATNQNVLWGDYFIVNTTQNFAQGGPVVHIEASSTDPRTTTPGGYTFYGRYLTPGWSAADNREALATTFATRFLQGGTFNSGTTMLTWRDSKVNQNPFNCPAATGNPAWFPLGLQGLVIFDEQEQPFTPPQCQVSPCLPNTLIPFPAETQRVQVGTANLPAPFPFGWMFINLNTGPVPGQTSGLTDPTAAQGWLTSTYSSNGHFAVAVEGIQLDNAGIPGTPHLHIP